MAYRRNEENRKERAASDSGEAERKPDIIGRSVRERGVSEKMNASDRKLSKCLMILATVGVAAAGSLPFLFFPEAIQKMAAAVALLLLCSNLIVLCSVTAMAVAGLLRLCSTLRPKHAGVAALACLGNAAPPNIAG